MIKLLATIKLF